MVALTLDTYAYDDVTYAYDDVTYAYDDVTRMVALTLDSECAAPLQTGAAGGACCYFPMRAWHWPLCCYP